MADPAPQCRGFGARPSLVVVDEGVDRRVLAADLRQEGVDHVHRIERPGADRLGDRCGIEKSWGTEMQRHHPGMKRSRPMSCTATRRLAASSQGAAAAARAAWAA